MTVANFKKSARGVVAGMIVLGVLASGGTGCATKTQTGLLVGGAGGAAAGAAIGSASGNAGKGALIGGAIGLIGGGLIGHAADKSDEAKEKDAREAEARSSRRYASGGGGSSRTGGTRITQDDVIAWSDKGTSDDVIVDRIERSDTVFRLTSADEGRLRDHAVSDRVILAMKGTGAR